MRERAARAQDLVPRGALELRIDLAGPLDALVVDREVEVNADPGRVHLGDAAGDEGNAGEAAAGVLLAHAALHVLAQRDGLAPGHRGLERFAQDPVLHHEVADVGDAEGELVAALAVLPARLHAAVGRRQPVDAALLRGHLLLAALEEQRARHHAIRVEAAQLQHVELLERALQVAEARLRRLQRLSELELEVVHQAHAGRHHAGALHREQEAEALLEALEQHRAEAPYLRRGKHLRDGADDDAQLAFEGHLAAAARRRNGVAMRAP